MFRFYAVVRKTTKEEVSFGGSAGELQCVVTVYARYTLLVLFLYNHITYFYNISTLMFDLLI